MHTTGDMCSICWVLSPLISPGGCLGLEPKWHCHFGIPRQHTQLYYVSTLMMGCPWGFAGVDILRTSTGTAGISTELIICSFRSASAEESSKQVQFTQPYSMRPANRGSNRWTDWAREVRNSQHEYRVSSSNTWHASASGARAWGRKWTHSRQEGLDHLGGLLQLKRI